MSVPLSNASLSGVAKPETGISFWRYLVIFLILIFLLFNLVLFLLKPVDADISELYDPVIKMYNSYFNSTEIPDKAPIKSDESAVKKLEKALNENKIINNIDNKQRIVDTQPDAQTPEPVKKYKKLPVIPEADDSTSNIQMGSTSKSGFCYIGEDRGFRHCIEVGEGDTCMSGSIFPTQAICINPNLRE